MSAAVSSGSDQAGTQWIEPVDHALNPDELSHTDHNSARAGDRAVLAVAAWFDRRKARS
jgi:hypothetical protein